MNIGKGVRANSLHELLTLHDEAFVRRAYQLVLGREADKAGLAHSVARVRKGDDRLAVLASLRFSNEGRGADIALPEIDALLEPYRKAFHPTWGRVLKKLRLDRRTSPMQRKINRLENQLARVDSGEHFEHETASPVRGMASLPSHKVTGNVSVAAQAWHDTPSIDRILLLKLDHFGDFFVAIRAFSLVREAWPHAHITLVCGRWNAKFADDLGLFDEILVFDMPVMARDWKNSEKQKWIGLCEGIKAIPMTNYDLAVDLRHDMDTRPCLLFIDAVFKAGYVNDNLNLPWPDGISPVNIGLHQTELHAELRCTLLAQLVITTLQPPEQHPISRLARPRSAQLPFPKGSYLVVSPGAAHSNRTWPAERFGELLRLIRKTTPYPVVFVGPQEDRAAIEKMAEFLPSQGYANLCGAAFEDLPWILANAGMFIGCDSGPGHLAALLGIPTLSIYGGVSSPHIWQPLGPRVTLAHSQTPCSYCHSKECLYDFRCMHEITVADVFSQFLALDAFADGAKI